jgi:hypothetical protein
MHNSRTPGYRRCIGIFAAELEAPAPFRGSGDPAEAAHGGEERHGGGGSA